MFWWIISLLEFCPFGTKSCIVGKPVCFPFDRCHVCCLRDEQLTSLRQCQTCLVFTWTPVLVFFGVDWLVKKKSFISTRHQWPRENWELDETPSLSPLIQHPPGTWISRASNALGFAD